MQVGTLFRISLNNNLHPVLLFLAVATSQLAHSQSAVCDAAAAHFQAHRWSDAAQAYAECEKITPENSTLIFIAERHWLMWGISRVRKGTRCVSGGTTAVR